MYHFPLKLVSRNKQTIAVVEEAALSALPFSLEHIDISEIRNYSELADIPPLTVHEWKIISLLTVSLEFDVDSLTDPMHNVQERTNWLLITYCSPSSSWEECVMIPFTLSAMGLRKLEEDAHAQLGTIVEGEYQIYILSETTQTSSSPVETRTSIHSYRIYSMLPFLQARHGADEEFVSLNDCNSDNLQSEEICTSTSSVISGVRNVEHNVTNDIDITECNNSSHEHDSVKVECERIAFCDTVEEMITVIMSTIRLSICKMEQAETHIFWPQMLTFPVNINCDIVKDRIAKHAALLLPKRPFLQHNQQFEYSSAYSLRTKLREYQANASALKLEKNLADMLEQRRMPIVKHENSGAWERHVLCEPHLLLKKSLSNATDATIETTNTIKAKFAKKTTKREVNVNVNDKSDNSYTKRKNDTYDKSVVLVKGKYNYYHYKIDGYNDDGWGCAYRSLQTILSWFQYAGYISEPIPTILTIQKILSVVDSDKSQKKSFVGSHEWIGSYEIMLVLQHFMPSLECTIQHIDSGAALDTDISLIQLLEAHFALPEACPVMIGGSSYAHTIAGMCIDKDSMSVQYLILDPHYSSNITNTKTIINKGYVGWKSAKKFFESNSWYNICIPRVDTYEPR